MTITVKREEAIAALERWIQGEFTGRTWRLANAWQIYGDLEFTDADIAPQQSVTPPPAPTLEALEAVMLERGLVVVALPDDDIPL